MVTFWFSLTPATGAWSGVPVPQIPWVHNMSWARLLYGILFLHFSDSILYEEWVEGTVLPLRCPAEMCRHNQRAQCLMFTGSVNIRQFVIHLDKNDTVWVSTFTYIYIWISIRFRYERCWALAAPISKTAAEDELPTGADTSYIVFDQHP